MNTDRPQPFIRQQFPQQVQQSAPQMETYWGLVLRQFCKNKLAVGSAIFVLTLFLIAIGAPFLADSKPIVFQGAYREQYQDRFEEWRRGGHPELLAQIEAMWEAQRESTDADDGEKLKAVQKLEVALGTVERQLLFLASQLSETEGGELTGYLDAYRAAVLAAVTTAATGEENQIAAAGGASAEMVRVTFEMTERRIAERFVPESVQLARKLYWPVIRDLRPVDLFFLTLALMVMVLTLARRALPPAIRRSARNQFLVLALPAVLATVLWSGRTEVFDTQSYKEQILNGQIESSFALFPPVPYGINEDHLVDKFQPPGGTYWMGTDGNGRDLMARMIWGARISLSVGFVAVAIYVTIGIFVGTLAGYFRGWVDMVFSRAIEIVTCFPAFFLILAVLAFLQPSMWNIMVVIGITGWTTEARLVRGEFLRLADQEFVVAARGLGVGSMRIIFRHILPNGLAPLLVSASFGVAAAILIESSLSFLGFGISIPVPSWGGILNEARESFRYWWITIFPGFAIFSTVTAYNLIGEGIRDAIDPRLKI